MENKIIITVGRQIGSGGLRIARMVAEKLGIEVYDRNLLMLAAKESGISQEILAGSDEKPARIGRFAKFLGIRSSIYTDAQMYSDSNMLSEDEVFALQSKVIKGIASKGSGVFVGRCADYVLRDCPEIFSVFITADMNDRIARVSERENLTPEEAKKYIESGQKRRTEYYNYYTFKKWGDSASYDICLNSSRFGLEKTADLIIEMHKNRNI